MKHKKIKDITGVKFNKLIVLKRMPDDKWGKLMWLVKCDCGKETIVKGIYLKNNHTKSCGCLRSIQGKITPHFKRPYEWIYNLLVACIKKRKLSIDFTYENFLEFTKINQCYYCGDAINWDIYRKNGVTPLRYNLDRKNNKIGYIKNNCVVCCKKCNSMKSILTEEDYIQQCKKVVDYQLTKSSVKDILFMHHS